MKMVKTRKVGMLEGIRQLKYVTKIVYKYI